MKDLMVYGFKGKYVTVVACKTLYWRKLSIGCVRSIWWYPPIRNISVEQWFGENSRGVEVAALVDVQVVSLPYFVQRRDSTQIGGSVAQWRGDQLTSGCREMKVFVSGSIGPWWLCGSIRATTDLVSIVHVCVIMSGEIFFWCSVTEH